MIPTGPQSLGPVLDALLDGQYHRPKEIRNHVAKVFKTTKQQMLEKTGDSISTTSVNHVAWALMHLEQWASPNSHVAFIVLDKKKGYQITEHGRTLRKKIPGMITLEDLKEY